MCYYVILFFQSTYNVWLTVTVHNLGGENQPEDDGAERQHSVSSGLFIVMMMFSLCTTILLYDA